MDIAVTADKFRLAEVFKISRGARTEAQVLTVRLTCKGKTGWGECVPYARYGETLESVSKEILALEPVFRSLSGADFDDLDFSEHLPAGAARNAVDCAFYDWRAKSAGRRIWDMLDTVRPPKPVITAYTLSLAEPEIMHTSAVKHAHRPLLKIKLGGDGDMARLEAVRTGAPKSRIIVDANEGWTAEEYSGLAPHLVRLGVEMVEQPLPAGADDILAEIQRPLPVCADESCHDRATLPGLRGKYDMINIKLDKTGGLTEALALKAEAERDGYGIMVGCMVGSSLAMAPAVLVAQGALITDLDGPLLLAEDRDVSLRFDEMGVHPPDAALWG